MYYAKLFKIELQMVATYKLIDRSIDRFASCELLVAYMNNCQLNNICIVFQLSLA